MKPSNDKPLCWVQVALYVAITGALAYYVYVLIAAHMGLDPWP